MKYRHVFITLFCIVCICAGCNSNRSNGIGIPVDYNEDYKRWLKYFPKKMVQHFPKRLFGVTTASMYNLSPDHGVLELTIYDDYNDIGGLPNLSHLTDKAVAVYSAGDSCLFVVNPFDNNKFNTVDSVKLIEYARQIKNNPCYIDKYPVPNFRKDILSSMENPMDLTPDFKIYVIEAKQGKFVRDNLLSSNILMPKEWEHGFSRGIAVSDESETVIYWLVIW